jgi:pimeloyl-ACP methyl ester carboxylesterase
MKPTPKELFPFIAVVLLVALRLASCTNLRQQTCNRDPEIGAEGWPQKIREIRYTSSADSTPQPAFFYTPKTKKAVPLLVALHTWSGNYRQKMSAPYAQWCIDKGWAFIHPNFRGPNRNPQATGSELVITDIISAVDYAKTHANVDTSRIYLVGVSGGGYTSLLTAARAPDVWAGVSAWVPITNLVDWYFECRKLKCEHADDIVKSCGGPPGTSPAIDLEYKKRSPSSYLNEAVNLPLDINAGIRDGHHSGGVPISHSLRVFNLVASEKDRISEEDIRYFVEKARVPPHLKKDLADPCYGRKAPLFRRTSGNARITIFDGGHEIVYEAALTWLAEQKRRLRTDTK